MKATHHIILITIIFLSCAANELKAQPSLVPAEEADKVETGIHIGDRVPDIVLESPTGEKIPLSSLRGKVVLIDFWAAWCPPCRRDNPNLVRLYHQYKDKEFISGSGFAIYSVSLDRSKEDWTAAIEMDSLDWTSHVSDLKGRQSPVIAEFEVRSIPFNTLIDGDGIILSVGLRGSHLEARLQELLKDPSNL
jgi:thiol-disulfide isomerase/thioredoxin